MKEKAFTNFEILKPVLKKLSYLYRVALAKLAAFYQGSVSEYGIIAPADYHL